jgi:UDP-GlcNAc:undecaprenyl-phosphate GlcNAc-1-phosphate transferase
MLKLIDQQIIFLYAFCFVLSLGGYTLLYYSKSTSISWIRKLLYVPARKSKTNALQLGGLPLSLSIIVSLFSYLLIFDDTQYFPPIDRSILKVWLATSLGIVGYGFLDDKYEFRPMVKLLSQVICMFVFSFFASMLFLSIDSRIAFILTFMGSLTVINGTNLLDGLDTLTIKNSMGILIAFFGIGGIFHCVPVVMLSALMMVPVGVFWFFNREPSKIHLGEIGGTFLGFSFVLLASLSYKWIGYYETSFDAFCYAIIPLSSPVVEVLVSSLRRLYNNKSMFKGDQLHLHHILNKELEYSHTKSSSIIGVSNIIAMGIGATIAYQLSPVIGLLSVVGIQVGWMLSVGHKYWGGSNTISLSPKAIFSSLRKKDITVIETGNVENFKFTILDAHEEMFEDSEESQKKVA